MLNNSPTEVHINYLSLCRLCLCHAHILCNLLSYSIELLNKQTAIYADILVDRLIRLSHINLQKAKILLCRENLKSLSGKLWIHYNLKEDRLHTKCNLCSKWTIYSNNTASAVSNFQRIHGLPVTGVTDQDTWDRIVAEYEPALILVDVAQPVEIILNPNEILRKSSESPYLYVAQALLQALSETYGSVSRPSMNGKLDRATSDSLSSFQGLLGLPMTGELDKHTWKHLALHFPLAANLSGR